MHDDRIYCIAVASMRNIEMCTQTESVEFKGTRHSDKFKGPEKFCSKAKKGIYCYISQYMYLALLLM